MIFKDFIQKLGSVLRAGSSTSAFTKTIFEAMLPEDRYDELEDYKPSTFKSFYNGSAPINKIARKINGFADPMIFSAFIEDHEDSAIEKLCQVFSLVIPDIEMTNAGDRIAALFSDILTEAAGANKKSALKDAQRIGFITKIAPELTSENAGSVFILDPVITAELGDEDEEEGSNPFEKYLENAVAYYSTKKTLLYAENPHPFYDLYVCNNICFAQMRGTSTREYKIISNVTVPKLEAESRYVIIQGIGGIGKSMLLTHLFLSSANQYNQTGRVPLFLSLKDYKDSTSGMVDFIWKAVTAYDPAISPADIIDALQRGTLVLLLDGLDEIQSSARESFDRDLDAFTKSYPGNTVIMTSRPVYSFLAYAKFSLFDIRELTKVQAIELVKKLEFWDIDAKNSFLEALDKTLYSTHRQFASNPLLLTIMLMTYTSFGEVPGKMHVFYSKAYETMARLHDASKGSFKRPLHTQLSPEQFAKYFSQFCARTYRDEVLEFDVRLFEAYMKKVLRTVAPAHQGIPARDFLLDLTDNLCIMYREGETFYFIHRSFQEYFAAVYFASEFDSNLSKVGAFFEKANDRSFTDRTFAMLYDMIPEKIERFIYLPYFEKLLKECKEKGKTEEYWEFLERLYPYLYYETGKTGESNFNEAESFLYRFIVEEKGIEVAHELDSFSWPDEINSLPAKVWVEVYAYFMEYKAYDEYPDPDPDYLPEELLSDTMIAEKGEVPFRYEAYFGEPDEEGRTIEIELYELRHNSFRYPEIRQCMEQPDFPLYREFQNVKKYYDELKTRTQLETESDDLFDD